jgi:hypothetical protein
MRFYQNIRCCQGDVEGHPATIVSRTDLIFLKDGVAEAGASETDDRAACGPAGRAGMDLLDRLLGHDAWTTRQLLLRCRELGATELHQRFDVGHASVALPQS